MHQTITNRKTSIKSISRSILLLSFSFLITIPFNSCNKDSTNTDNLPVFGTCKPVATAGHLSYNRTTQQYTFRTNGGGTILYELHKNITITHDSFPGFRLEFWGDLIVSGQTRASHNHENLNGKHIKDRIGSLRTIVFPDGAKITFVADGTTGQLLSLSIYDIGESHHINPTCSTLEYSSMDNVIAKKLDDAEADGEAGTIEFISTGLLFNNIYTENTAGNKIFNLVPLGEIFFSTPGSVNDYYDDLRLGHT